MNSNRRFWKDLKDAVLSTELEKCGVIVRPEQLFNVTVSIKGPCDSLYEGGKYDFIMEFPQRYPFVGPIVKSLTKIWHPNISSVTGLVCLDVISTKWIPSMTVSSTALSVQNLLKNPEGEDPLDAIVGNQMIRHRDIFETTARHWTAVFAGGPNVHGPYQEMTNTVVDMGFSPDRAISALSQAHWNKEEAVAILVS